MNPRTIYYWFQALSTFGTMCTAAIYALFLFSIGLSIAEVAAINVAFWTIIILGEVPTGMFADGRSRVWSIRTGAALRLAGVLVYFVVTDVWSALAAELVVGLAEAFLSGVLQAWITDALGRRGEANELRRVFATASVVRGAAALAVGILGAFVGALIGLRAVWLLAALFLVGALILAWWGMRGDGEPLKRISGWAAFGRAIRVLAARRALWWAAAAAVVAGVSVPIGHYWAPFYSARLGGIEVFSETVCISPWLGVVWTIVFVPVTIAGFLVRRLSVRLGQEAVWVAGSLVLSGIGVAFIGLLPGLLAPSVLLVMHEIGRGAFEPLLESFTQHRIESSYRATYGSLQSLIGRFGYAGTLAGVWVGTSGAPSTLATMVFVLVVCGSIQAGLAILLWLLRPADAR
ncbi:MFS transporter [Candidatus Uhrbacteria bacterium]|nr:MFS transporter [Candidatus Uhrbacteria bacterium]